MSEMKKRYEQALAEFNEKKAELEKVLSASGRELLKEIFEPYLRPPLRGLVWRQYTPYFNDGEPCVFNLYEPDFLIDGETEPLYGWVMYSKGSFSGHEKLQEAMASNPNLESQLVGLVKAFWAQPTNLYELTFGDHQEVTVVRRDGELVVTNEEYDDHD